MADVEDYRKDMEAFFKMAKYPLVRQTDMLAEMREEAVDVCVTAVEKHQADMEKCTQAIKEALDRKFGPRWHVIAGNYFSFEITHECKNLLYLFIGGTTGVLVWKM
ncbi:hypothetical protein WJX84_003532 [Apatococcus fuscideae]|uniref:Dynein light chain n=1 Tax=Apatococcus fuscideae TaxID=2026836 RepID=A0AAW1T2K9_9CHLO